MPVGQALVLAIGMASFVIGIWEMPFRFIAYYHYGTSYWPAAPFLTYGVLQEMPNVLGGAFIIWFYNRRYHLLHMSINLAIFSVLFVASWIVWVSMGFWLDPIYNGSAIVYNPVTDTSYIQYVLFRGTKALLNCMILFAMIPKVVAVKSEFTVAEQKVLLAAFRLESRGTKEYTGFRLSKEIGPSNYWPHSLMSFGTLYRALDSLVHRDMLIRTKTVVESEHIRWWGYQLTDAGRVAVTCRIVVHV
jgi:hypothetical protein